MDGRPLVLWAGYCFFDFAKVARLPLDFGLDWFAGLDTGRRELECSLPFARSSVFVNGLSSSDSLADVTDQ